MIRSSVRTFVLIAALITTALSIAACGESTVAENKKTNSIAEKGGTDAGRLTHIDGSLQLEGETLTLQSAQKGADDYTFELGPAVARGTVQALVSSNARARVFFDASAKDEPTLAVAVEPAPTAGADAETYDGTITDVSDKTITIDGDDGERTFDIDPKAQASFDIPHLEEHQGEGSPVRIYYEGSGADAKAVAYEDT